ncbi:MAG: TRAP transporter small permease subunit [Geopsychrobacter sp.]|nr:TRAP transporter small permease subunit [Geopsychrobacter sp.]
MLLKIESWFDKFADIVGNLSAFLLVLMLCNVFYDAIARYFFRSGSIAMQEMEWHLFALTFLFGISYCLKEDGHVRVDIIYDRLSIRAKASINILGTIFLLLPLCFLIVNGSLEFVKESYLLHEISGDPGGLTHRYLIKAMIPLSFVMVIISAGGFILHNVNMFLGLEREKPHSVDDDVL